MSAAEVVQTMTLHRFPQKRRFPPKPKVRLSLHKAMSLADWKELRMMSVADRPIARLCRSCGQFHSPTDSHLYDYHKPVDDDLTCGICLQPLVDPVDTKCGHTFCSKCIRNFLKLQYMCPNDRNPITSADLQPAPVLIRRLLDKLEVVCPNVDYCEAVLARCELEDHLIYRCKGAVIRCHRHEQGCKFQGPRSAMESHLCECEYNDDKDFSLTEEIQERKVTRISIPRGTCDLGISIVGGCDTALGTVVVQEIFPNGLIDRDDRLKAGDQILEVNGVDMTLATHYQAKKAFNQILPLIKMTVYRDSSARNHAIEREDILKITLLKDPGKPLGIKLVGKRNSSGVYIKELIPGSVAALDGQLKVNDRILEVNSDDLSILSQEYAANHIQAAHGKLQLVVSRRCDTLPLIRSPSKLTRQDSQFSVLSRLDSPRLTPRGSPKGSSVNLNKYSQFLDLKQATRRCSNVSNISIVSQENQKSVSSYASFGSSYIEEKFNALKNARTTCKEKTIIVTKAKGESLGLSVAGGKASQRGDTPLYVMHTLPDGPAARSGVKKGDVLLSVNGAKILDLNHDDAVAIIKSKAGHRKVELKLLDTCETADGNDNFLPTWMYWLDLPSECWMSHEVKLDASNSDLGFILSGGKDCTLGEEPIFIKAVESGSQASQHLKPGDVVLAINGESTTDMDLSDATCICKDAVFSPDSKLTMTVVSWPGSIV